MTLTRFREVLSVPRSMYHVMEPTEITSSLKESFNLALKNNQKKLQESSDTNTLIKAAMKLRESADDKALFDKIIEKLKTSGAGQERKLWKFPVSRFGNKNGNGRVYPRQLWENVINNQRDIWQGGVGLADHPKDDDDPGEFKTSSIVWLDMMIDDANKLIWAIGTFVGTYGRLAQEIIEAGGHVGFSSSGFGELGYDGMTINPDTYQIERVADIVTNPSQSVFGDISNTHEDTNIEYSKQQKESMNPSHPKSEILKERNNMAAVDATKMQESTNTTTSASPKISKVEKQIIIKYVEGLASEAEKIKKPTDRLKETSKILEMVEESGDEELKAKVQESLVAARNELEAMVESAVNIQAEVGSDLNTFVENAKDIAKQGVLLNEQVKDYKLLAEGLQERNQTLYKENQVLKSKLALKNQAIKTKNLKENKALVENNTRIDSLKENYTKAVNEMKALKESNDKLAKANKRFETDNDILTRKLNEAVKAAKAAAALRESNTKNSKDVESLNSQISSLKEQIDRLQKKNTILSEKLDAKDAEFTAYREDQKMENHIEPKFESYVGSQLNFRENKGIEVENYWNDLCNQFGEATMKPFEQSIRGAKTYREAFNAFMKNRARIDEDAAAEEEARISESIVNQKERREYLKESGMSFESNEGLTVDEINEAEYKEMLRKGFI